MPIRIGYVGTLLEGSFELPSGTVSMVKVAEGSGYRVVATDYSFGAAQDLSLDGAGLPQILSTDWDVPTERVALDVAGIGAASLPRSVIDTAIASWAAGNQDGQLAYLGQGAEHAKAATVLAAELGGQTLLFVAPADAGGVTAFTLDANGHPTARQALADNDAGYLGNVAGLAVIETDQGAFLYAGSASEHGLSGYRIGAGGALTPVQHLGREQSLPVQTVTALEVAKVAGQDFLIVAAAGSSSLSVLAVAEDGTMTPADHLIDGRDTRFSGVTQVEVVSVNDHVFVLAAGGDDGLSLFALTAPGRLVHLDTLPDMGPAALEGVSGLAALPVDGGFEVVTTASGESGLSLFRVDFDTSGAVVSRASGQVSGTGGDDWLSVSSGAGTLTGGAGDDILSDGAGADRLSGGAGADIFVLTADGVRDVITDVEVGRDQLDLSSWGMLYSAGQLEVESTSWGAIIRFQGEELELHRDGGGTLDAAAVAALLPTMLSRYDIDIAPLQVATPEPDPVPAPPPAPPPPPAPEPDPVPEPVPVPEPEPEPVPVPDPVPPPGRKLTGGNGADVLTGGAGDDSIDAGGGDDTLNGGAGDDGLKGRAGDDLIYGGAGDDRLPGESGNDTIYGEDGNDRLGGGDGHDLMIGGAGRDRGGGGHGNDTIEGGDGDDWFSGGGGTDQLDGGAGNDRLAGSYGRDTVVGGDGDDTMGGGTGEDVMIAGAGDDVVGAGDFDDNIWGNAGNDRLGGGAGNDVIRGGSGADSLNGGYGDDTLWGGSGADVFVFNARSAGGHDEIQDFETGVDVLRLVGRRLPPDDPLSHLTMNDASVGGQEAVHITYGSHKITVLGLSASDLDEDDFLFV